jgi:hypothetical protein
MDGGGIAVRDGRLKRLAPRFDVYLAAPAAVKIGTGQDVHSAPIPRA